MKISLFIPTYNAISCCGESFKQNLDIIKNTKLYRVLIIDSSSMDNTVEVSKSYGFEVLIIPKNQFDHGGTRNLAAEMLADSDIIVYLTQDVLLDSSDSILKLVTPIITNSKIAVSYGRQRGHTNADIFAKHLRKFNYSRHSYIRSYDDRYVWGMRTVFSSDSFAAYNVNCLQEINGFPRHLILGEDVYVTAKLLKSGYKIAYVADAICYHSHNYSLKQEFQRYFDIGVFHRSESWIHVDFGTANKEGIKFVLSICNYVFLRKPWLLPQVFMKILAKYSGYKFGVNYDKIGVRMCRKLSMNEAFWWES